MEPEIIIIVVLLCLGAAQGLIYGVILWRSESRNKTSNRILSAILFFLSYRLVVETLLLFGYGRYDTLYHFMIDVNWVYGPLIYFYVKSRVQVDFRFQSRDWVHFSPLLIQFICSNFVRAQNFIWDGTHESLSWLGLWGYKIWMNYPTMYIIASLLIIFYSFKAEKLFKKNGQSNRVVDGEVSWISRVLLAFRIYFALVLSILLLDLLVFQEVEYYYFTRFYYYPFFIGMAILTYWLAIAGFTRKDQRLPKKTPVMSDEERQLLEKMAIDLGQLMEKQKLYTHTDLSLATLAKQLETKPYLLSKCLKTQLSTKFSDYINEYRLQELKRLLKDKRNEKFTLLSLAYEAGFNSKASFNRASKKHLGLSPSDLRKQLKESGE